MKHVLSYWQINPFVKRGVGVCRWMFWGWLCFGYWLSSLMAQTPPPPPPTQQHFQIQKIDDTWAVGAHLQLTVPDAVEEALRKGVPIYFVWRLDVLQSRWYWADKWVWTGWRTWRLSFSPLTQRWRVSLSTEAPSSTGVGPFLWHQNYDTVAAAMRAIGRVSNWHLPEQETWAGHYVQLQFGLDTSQLPRPMQMGLINANDWSMAWHKKSVIRPIQEGREQ